MCHALCVLCVLLFMVIPVLCVLLFMVIPAVVRVQGDVAPSVVTPSVVTPSVKPEAEGRCTITVVAPAGAGRAAEGPSKRVHAFEIETERPRRACERKRTVARAARCKSGSGGRHAAGKRRASAGDAESALDCQAAG